MAKTFPLFPHLPAELRLKIWEASYQRPGIHIFDVCFPRPEDSGQNRVRQAFTALDSPFNEERKYETYRDKIFLDNLNISPSCDGTSGARFASDPSEYINTNALSLTCVDSAKVIGASMDDGRGGKNNTVYLPGKEQRLSYDNTSDILCLRFGICNELQDSTSNFLTKDNYLVFPNNISRVLEGRWSEEMATTLYAARRIAIDISELWSPTELDPSTIIEVASLCSCIQHGLEELCLIDYCVGRCQRCRKGKLTSKELGLRKCDLAKDLDPDDRAMDIVYGTRVIYREICDLEGLGWHSEHPVFMLTKMMGEMIREQQGGKGPFRSVRILVCDEEADSGDDSIVCMKCNEDDG